MQAIPSFLLFSLILAAIGCQHFPDVRPMANGTHKVMFNTERKGEGFRQAMSQAQSYCRSVKNANAVQVSETSEYSGDIDENIYNLAKTASKVAVVMGVGGAIAGGKTESDVGQVTAVGGGVADTVLGQGYQYTLEFQCQ
jgi:hypothetical protein